MPLKTEVLFRRQTAVNREKLSFREMNGKARCDCQKRCKWCNIKNPKYVEYHDNEWCRTNFDDKYLYEMLILESFQAGLSWECILNKRDSFRLAYDGVFCIKKGEVIWILKKL